MYSRHFTKKKKHLYPIIAFLITLLLCSIPVFISIKNRLSTEEAMMEQIIMEKTTSIHNEISQLLYRNDSLSAFIRQSNGNLEHFDDFAATLVDHPAILNVLAAPDGIVRCVYPYETNKMIIGFDFLGDDEGNIEAVQAIESGSLVFGGPFHVRQGGQVLVGRLPVYLNDEVGNPKLWGLTSVTLRYPEVLEHCGLTSLDLQGYSYEIWRINPDNKQPQIIAGNQHPVHKNARYIERKINLMNTEWYFRLGPVRTWYQYSESWLLITISLSISTLAAAFVYSNASLQEAKHNLETLIRIDTLTQILNRKGIFQMAASLIEANTPFCLYYMDLNKFKPINDTYGHHVGDQILIAFSRSLSKHLPPGAFLGRIGGDEFVLIHTIDEHWSIASDDAFWSKVHDELPHQIPSVNGQTISLTFSKGAAVHPDNAVSIDQLLLIADQNMYQAKQQKMAKGSIS